MVNGYGNRCPGVAKSRLIPFFWHLLVPCPARFLTGPAAILKSMNHLKSLYCISFCLTWYKWRIHSYMVKITQSKNLLSLEEDVDGTQQRFPSLSRWRETAITAHDSCIIFRVDLVREIGLTSHHLCNTSLVKKTI